jgi:effector-binding domain-containing protein
VTHDVAVKVVKPQLIAAVRTQARIREIATAWKPALDQVWAFLKADGTIKPGHNLFLYHHPAHRDLPIEIDFGVEVDRTFGQTGNVRCVETPAGEIAWTRHIGPYDRLREAHDTVHAWCAAHRRPIGNASWETYGDWNNDPAKLETTVSYLLAPAT